MLDYLSLLAMLAMLAVFLSGMLLGWLARDDEAPHATVVDYSEHVDEAPQAWHDLRARKLLK